MWRNSERGMMACSGDPTPHEHPATVEVLCAVGDVSRALKLCERAFAEIDRLLAQYADRDEEVRRLRWAHTEDYARRVAEGVEKYRKDQSRERGVMDDPRFDIVVEMKCMAHGRRWCLLTDVPVLECCPMMTIRLD